MSSRHSNVNVKDNESKENTTLVESLSFDQLSRLKTPMENEYSESSESELLPIMLVHPLKITICPNPNPKLEILAARFCELGTSTVSHHLGAVPFVPAVRFGAYC